MEIISKDLHHDDQIKTIYNGLKEVSFQNMRMVNTDVHGQRNIVEPDVFIVRF